jgi:hypothetical protein
MGRGSRGAVSEAGTVVGVGHQMHHLQRRRRREWWRRRCCGCCRRLFCHMSSLFGNLPEGGLGGCDRRCFCTGSRQRELLRMLSWRAAMRRQPRRRRGLPPILPFSRRTLRPRPACAGVSGRVGGRARQRRARERRMWLRPLLFAGHFASCRRRSRHRCCRRDAT